MTGLLDLEGLTAPLDDEAPCGQSLEEFAFDPEFTQLERLAQGKPEQVMGDEVIPGEEPDWGAVEEKSLELFARVRSLRVAVLLSKALTEREGLAGLRESMALIEALLERYWDDVEPLIDDGDATERQHTLAELASQQGLLNNIKRSLLVSAPAVGRFTVRDFLIAADKLKPGAADEATSPTTIHQALMDCELDELKALIDHLDAIKRSCGQIERRFNNNVANDYLLDLEPLGRLLGELRPPMHEALERRGIAVDGDEPSGTDVAGDEGAIAAPAAGEIRSREDVVRMIDRITEYYNRYEPSSPVPLLLQRAKRLVSADFMAIMKDVASDGVKQADLLLGGDAGNEKG